MTMKIENITRAHELNELRDQLISLKTELNNPYPARGVETVGYIRVTGVDEQVTVSKPRMRKIVQDELEWVETQLKNLGIELP